ncbi:MAG TPA: sugar phosphate nucleotidyltransferase [Kiritimatiellia bacterium]|nr:sugar phosphate nucleotidyltransferase [Kiritimatiellia bacterium]HMP34252.1 sugar phosphate nucleotidyltransferase [Kiritimatiellia bacterium]
MNGLDQVILLSGGLGTRLQGLFPELPKALAPIAGKPFIEWQIAWLHSLGVTAVHIAAGFRAEQIEAWYRSAPSLPVSVTFSREPAPLGTGGAIRFAADALPPRVHYLVMNGDTLLPNLNLGAIIKAHLAGTHTLTMAVTSIPDASRYGMVEVDRDGCALAFREKSPEIRPGVVNGGVYAIRRALIDRIPAGESCSLEKTWFPTLVAERGIRCTVTEPPLLDMGTPDGHAAMTDFMTRREHP